MVTMKIQNRERLSFKRLIFMVCELDLIATREAMHMKYIAINSGWYTMGRDYLLNVTGESLNFILLRTTRWGKGKLLICQIVGHLGMAVSVYGRRLHPFANVWRSEVLHSCPHATQNRSPWRGGTRQYIQPLVQWTWHCTLGQILSSLWSNLNQKHLLFQYRI